MTDQDMTTFSPPPLADIRPALASCYSGRITRLFAGVWFTVEKAGGYWTVDLLSAGHNLTERAARELCAPLNVPDGAVWTSTENGAVWSICWEEG